MWLLIVLPRQIHALLAPISASRLACGVKDAAAAFTPEDEWIAPEDAAAMGWRGRERCREDFDWRVMVRRLVTLYEKLLGGSNG